MTGGSTFSNNYAPRPATSIVRSAATRIAATELYVVDSYDAEST